MEKNYQVYQKKQTAMFAKIGEAVHLWSNLETQIFFLAAKLLKKNYIHTALVLKTFRSFRATFDLVEALVNSVEMNEEQTLFWMELKAYILELSGDRNFIAHTSVAAHGEGDLNNADWSLVEPKIGQNPIPHYLCDTKRIDMPLEEVEQITLDIQQCVELLLSFRQSVFPDDVSLNKPLGELRRRRAKRADRSHRKNQ